MAKGGGSKQNQTAQAGLTRIGDTNVRRGEEAYGYGTGVRDYVTEKYKALLEGAAGGGGGGGGGGGPDLYTQDLETIRKTGGFNPDQVEALRGYGIPKQWAQTGGWTDPEMTNFRLRTTASVPGFFDAMRRNLDQRTAVSGGYGPGLDAASIALAREQARGGAAASLESEGRLQEDIRANKKWASQTGSDMEARIFGNQKEALNQLIAKKNAAIARGDAAAARSFSEQMAVLGAMRGLRGETGAETEYDQLALRGYGGGLDQQKQGGGAQGWVNTGVAAAGTVAAILGGKAKDVQQLPAARRVGPQAPL